MSTYHTTLTPAQQSAAILHVDHFMSVEPDILLKMQLSYLEMLTAYLLQPVDGRLGIRKPDSIINDTMLVCNLLQGVYEAAENEADVPHPG